MADEREGGTAERLIRLEDTMLRLADVAEDLIHDMEADILTLRTDSKKAYQREQVQRARELGKALRDAVGDFRARRDLGIL